MCSGNKESLLNTGRAGEVGRQKRELGRKGEETKNSWVGDQESVVNGMVEVKDTLQVVAGVTEAERGQWMQRLLLQIG